MNEIDVLYFDDCPNWQTGLANLRALIAADHLAMDVRLVEIHNPQQAQAEHFLGSPSFRMNGVDLWPEPRSSYDLSCRVYHTPQGMRGSPTIEMLRERISAIQSQ